MAANTSARMLELRAKAETRKRLATPRAQKEDALRKVARREMIRAAEGQRVLQARAQRQLEAVAHEVRGPLPLGNWLRCKGHRHFR